VDLKCYPDVTFSKLDLNTLRFHLNGDSNLVSALYELLGNNCVQIIVRDTGPNPKRPVVLPAESLRPVGFGPDEGMLPIPRRSMVAFRLIQEYFTFPEKFSFFDLDGFDRVRAAGFGSTAEVVFLISSFERAERRQVLESGVGPRSVLLGCTPIVNLFEQTSEPIALVATHYEYPVVADARRRETTKIFSIDEITAARPGSPEVTRFEPLYSQRHRREPGQAEVFWTARRRMSEWDPGDASDVYLAFADLSGRPARPSQEAATARTTCYNGDLPGRLPFGDEHGDFTLLGGGPIQKIVALVKPTAVVQAPLGKPLLWRLISQLSLNYASLVDGGADALREVLRLHNFGDSAAGEKQIQGITDVRSEPCYTRVHGAHGLSFARGHRVSVTFDEEQFAGSGVYLLASVLDRFLGVYTTLNSFSILVASTKQRKEALREWPARAGWKALV
jgi:type VI secretion system protein ImpG